MRSPGTNPLRRLWNAWKPIGERIARAQAVVLFTVFYIVIVTPFAVIARWLSGPLNARTGGTHGWVSRDDGAQYSLDRAKRQS